MASLHKYAASAKSLKSCNKAKLFLGYGLFKRLAITSKAVALAIDQARIPLPNPVMKTWVGLRPVDKQASLGYFGQCPFKPWHKSKSEQSSVSCAMVIDFVDL